MLRNLFSITKVTATSIGVFFSTIILIVVYEIPDFIYHNDSSIQSHSFRILLFALVSFTAFRFYLKDQRTIEKLKLEQVTFEEGKRFDIAADAVKIAWWEMDIISGAVVFHHRKADMIGFPPEKFRHYKDFTDLLHPDDYNQMMQSMKDHISGLAETYDTEYRIMTSTGEYKWFNDIGTVIKRDSAGKPLKIAGIVIDISYRKQSEILLKESEKRYRLMAENTSDVIWVMDFNSQQFTYISPSILDLRGYTPEEAMQMNLRESITAESYEKIQAIIPARLNEFTESKGKSIPDYYEVQQPCKNGDIIWVENSFRFRYNANGELEVVGVSRNIDSRKKFMEEIELKNEQLLKLNAEKDKFFSILAHDLRNPFHSFLGLTHILAEDFHSLTMDELQEIALLMQKSAQNMYGLLENLLEWSSLQRNLLPYYPAPYQLNPTASDAIEILTAAFAKKEILFSNTISDDISVIADSKMINSVIRNLLTNAVKFTPHGGNVTLSAKPVTGNMVEISVQDTGIGMSSKIIDNLFFLEIKTSREGTDGEPSTGLGLIICKDFVEKHGGNLWAESTEGNGSTFHFTIPGKIEPREKIQTDNTAIAMDATEAPRMLKIVIAEDDLASERLISMAIRQYAKEVVKVKTGAEAIELCRERPDIDLILMDIKMPGMNGYDAARQIRQFNSKTIIIAQSAYAPSIESNDAIEAGFNDCISKPYDAHELKAMVQKYFTI
jgi:PAS domain S-box-containing protein